MMPMRVGLSPTWSMTISDPGSAAAATIQNAADEISPGTWSVRASQPLATRARTTRVPARPTCDAECVEGAFRVVARGHRLDDPCHPFGVQPGEQHGALDLRARHVRWKSIGLRRSVPMIVRAAVLRRSRSARPSARAAR